MFKCKDCGLTYEEMEDAKEESEIINYGDRTYTEHYYVCRCGGGLEEVHKCKFCDNLVEEREEVCESCLTMEKCVEIGEEHKQCLELNGFIASSFETSEIEEILLKVLKEAEELKKFGKSDFKEYLESL